MPAKGEIPMLIFALILFAVSVPFMGIGIALLRGKADLIMEHHQTRVTDKAAYAKAFSVPMFIIAGSMVMAGLFALPDMAAWSMGAFLCGLTVAIVWIICVQVKYDRGLF